METLIDKDFVNGWECVDNTCLWYGKPFDIGKQAFIKTVKIDQVSENKDADAKYMVVSSVIDVDCMSDEEIESVLCRFYDSSCDMVAQLGGSMGTLVPLIASYIFDSLSSYQYQTDPMSWAEAEKFIMNYMEEN